MLDLKRRDFITLLGGAVAWPLAARAAGGDARGGLPHCQLGLVANLNRPGGNVTGATNLIV